MHWPSVPISVVMVSAAAALCGCRFELDDCSVDSDCADHGCPDGEEPFCDIGNELFGNCACRAMDGVGGGGGAGGT